MSERNAEIIKNLVGKRLKDVIDTNDDTWYDPDGFVMWFDDGTHLTISADMSQGVGYVITDINKAD